MKSIDFAPLRRADATRWLDYVELRGPARLVELAEFMHADDGPIGQANASWDSLSIVWEWAVDFVRRGGGTSIGGKRRQASRVTGFGLGGKPTAFGAVAEDLGHYVFEVVRSIEPTTHWALYLSPDEARVKDARHQATGIKLGSCWWNVESDLPRFLRRASEGDAAMADPRSLQRWVTQRLDVPAVATAAPANSILSPLVGTSRSETPTPVFAADKNPAEPTRRYPHHVMYALSSSDSARQGGEGVPAETVMAFLDGLGFEFDNSHGDTALRNEPASFLGWLYSRGMAVEVIGHGGHVASVHFDPLAMTADEWNEFQGSARRFARDHRGVFHARES